jgi:membrane-bound metal-dependent hydrolase YbcI (DUF457 family)
MFIGHFAVALAAKKAAPKTSLATLFLSVQLVDFLWPIFLVLGIEHVRIDPGNTAVTPLDFYNYPFTHSLLAALLWSAGFGVLYFLIKRYKTGALVVGAGVFSHWILDAITHRPDLPLYPGSATYIGLGLWNSVPATIIVELSLFVGGILLYLRTTGASNRSGRIALWSLVAFLIVVWISNLLGPPPPSETAIGYLGLAMWLFIPWGMWIEKNRSNRIA